jgi:Zn-dependent peptidase ImmA (M78 family)/DNA-binding Xre family transcriptional regulator
LTIIKYRNTLCHDKERRRGERAVGVRDIGSNVRRHMKIRGLTIPMLSKKAGIGTATLSNLINGKAEPKSSTLLGLAEALEIPVQQLIVDSPDLRSLRFRTAKSLSGREKAERDQLRHDTALWLANYRFLEQELGEVRPYLLSGMHEKDPQKAASLTRRSLQIASWAILDLPQLMEHAGIKLRVRPFGFKKTFGLSVGEGDGGPAIVVNSEKGIPVERQLFSIVHELGHLVLHGSSYEVASVVENAEEERDANAFAGDFLLPEEGLRAAWEYSKGLHWVEGVLHIKKLFKVSYMTVLVRLNQLLLKRDIGLVIAQFRKEYAERYGQRLKDHYEPDSPEGPVASEDPKHLDSSDLVEDRFARLVRRAFEREFISIGRAAEMLGLSLEEMRSLANAWQEM